jgi:hypothetical protein
LIFVVSAKHLPVTRIPSHNLENSLALNSNQLAIPKRGGEQGYGLVELDASGMETLRVERTTSDQVFS